MLDSLLSESQLKATSVLLLTSFHYATTLQLPVSVRKNKYYLNIQILGAK